MIVRPRPHWLRLLFVTRGSVVGQIAPQLLGSVGFAVLVTWLHGTLFRWKIPLNFVPFSLIGLTLAIFLGFRNSTSYARYWEARTLWGAVLTGTRASLRQVLTLVDPPAGVAGSAAARPHAMHLIAFTHALRHQLRRTDASADLRRLLPEDECERLRTARFPPALLLLMVGEWLGARHRAGALATALVPALERPLEQLGLALGGCERIAHTPIPFTYAVMIHRTIYLYCVLLPFGLVDSIGAMTPVIVGFVSYTFLALEALAAELEEPFGLAPNDLALDAMSRTIEATLREMLGEQVPPADEPPVDFIST